MPETAAPTLARTCVWRMHAAGVVDAGVVGVRRGRT